MTPDDFFDRLKESGRAEPADSQSFLKERYDFLSFSKPYPTPHNSASSRFGFDRAVGLNNSDIAVNRAHKSQITQLLETPAAVDNVQQLDDGRFVASN